MATRRFHLAGERLEQGRTLTLRGAPARHIATVLRLRAGDRVILFDGQGSEHEAIITGFSQRDPMVEIGVSAPLQPASQLPVNLGVAISKGSAMDFIVQKATELGVTEITPLVSARSEVRLNRERGARRVEHWNEIAISACEQCGRHFPPLLHPVSDATRWMAGASAELKLLLHPAARRSLATMRGRPDSIALMTGPEGGFSDAEVREGSELGFQAVRVGPRTLRADTAPLVGLTLVQSLWGDLSGT